MSEEVKSGESAAVAGSADGAARMNRKHPKGLYYLFGTEAMERFSYYGMRALLVLYLTAATTAAVPGFGMERSEALAIYALYTSLVYLTPLIGGALADKFLGARKSIFIGGLVMMLGEFALMLSSGSLFMFYLGLALLILGNGFFKPNASTIVGELYEPNDPRRDGAFTIFYMGINVGAFFSPLICGTIGEKFGFQYGFAAAAIGMLIGIIIFALGQNSFAGAGFPKDRKVNKNSKLTKKDLFDIGWITGVTAAIALASVVLLPYISEGLDFIPNAAKGIIGAIIVVAVITGLFGLAYKGGAKELQKKINDAKDYLEKHPDSEENAKSKQTEAQSALEGSETDAIKALEGAEADALEELEAAEGKAKEAPEELTEIKIEEFKKLASMTKDDIAAETKKIAIADMKAVAAILLICLFVIFFWLGFEQAGGTMTIFAQQETDRVLPFINWEVPTSYFQAINPIFIVLLAPLFSKMWYSIDTSKYRFSVIYKMVIALCLLGLGFLLLYAGQSTVTRDASGEITGKANMLFLIGVYFIHTCGELCLSPIGLSLITKLSPVRMVSLMMGVWLLTSSIANYFAGNLDAMLSTYQIPIFVFLIFSSFGAAAALFLISFGLKKWMKGY